MFYYFYSSHLIFYSNLLICSPTWTYKKELLCFRYLPSRMHSPHTQKKNMLGPYSPTGGQKHIERSETEEFAPNIV